MMHSQAHLVRVIGTLSLQPRFPGSLPPLRSDGGRRDPELAPAQRQFLAALVAFGPPGATAETLADTVWFGELPRQWKPSLRMKATRLRRSIGFDVIPSGRFRLDLDPGQVDVWHLLALAADVRTPTEAELCWALAGEPYPGVELAGPLLQANIDARRAQKRLAIRFCEASPVEVSDAVCGRLELLVSSDPIDADVAVAVGRCLHEAGRRADAVRLLHRFTAAHVAYLGVAPPGMVEDLLGELICPQPG